MAPTISVCIPSHRSELLQDAMRSVLVQDYPRVQLIVNYTPGTIPYWRTKINETVATAVGDYVMVLCDDDLLLPGCLAKMAAKAEEGYEFVYSDWIRRKLDGKDYHWPQMPWVHESFMTGCCPVGGSTYLVRRDRWNALGGIDPEQLYWDFAFAYECFRAGLRSAWIQEPLILYREHDGQTPCDGGRALHLLRTKYPDLSPYTHDRIQATLRARPDDFCAPAAAD